MTVRGTHVRTFDDATFALPDGIHMNADYPFTLPKIVERTTESITIEGRNGKRDAHDLSRLKRVRVLRVVTIDHVRATVQPAAHEIQTHTLQGRGVVMSTKTLRWISWEQHGDAEHDPDCHPVAWPPPAEVLAFWETGLGGEDGADAYCTELWRLIGSL